MSDRWLRDPHSFHGRVEMRPFQSEVLAGNPLGDPCEREVPVYVPPAPDGPQGDLPVVFLLVGFTGRPHALLETHPWKGGVVQELDRAGRGAAHLAGSRCRDDHGDMAGTFKQIALLPEAVRPEVISVVRNEDDDGIVSQFQIFQSLRYPPKLLIHHRDGRVICLDDFLSSGDCEVTLSRAIVKCCQWNVISVIREFQFRNDLVLRIQIEESSRSDIGGMRAVEPHSKKERSLSLLRM